MITGRSNKGMKQTKPSVLELRSLSPVLDRPFVEPRGQGVRSGWRILSG